VKRTYPTARTCLRVVCLLMLLVSGWCTQVFAATTVTMWYNWASVEEEILLSLVEKYNKMQTDIVIEAVKEDHNKLLVAIAGGAPPDVSQVPGESIFDMAQRNLLLPLPPFVQQNPAIKDLASVKIMEGSYEGKLYGMPVFPVDVNGSLVWNKEHFLVAGINTDAPPTTIKNLETYAAKLTKVNAEGRIIQAGFIPWNAVGSKPFTWGWRFGGDFYDYETGKVTATDPKNVEAFTWLTEYGMRYGLATINEFNSRYGKYYAADSALFQGVESMQVLYSNTPGHAQMFAPDLELGHGYLPAPEGQSLPFGWLGGWQMGIPNGSQHPEEAARFLLWLIEPEQQQEWQKRSGFIMPRISANNLNLLPKESHFYVDMLMAAKYYRPTIAPVNAYNNQLLAGLMDILAGKTTPIEVLTNVERNIQGML
jgi:multiple sugar transport system substrate-binding protein